MTTNASTVTPPEDHQPSSNLAKHEIAIGALAWRDLAAATRLLAAQEARQFAADVRLRSPRSPKLLESTVRGLIAGSRGEPFAVHDRHGRLLGAAVAGLWDVPPESELRGFYGSRNGTVPLLVLPHPDDPKTQLVTDLLLTALDDRWRESRTTGEIISLPTIELREFSFLSDLLASHGYLQTFDHALRPLSPLPEPSRATDIVVRAARREDEAALIALHIDEVAFHVDHCPFVRVVPALEAAFRRQLARVWAGAQPTSDAPLLTVVERDGDVIAMAESYISMSQDSPLPMGRYGYLNSVGVRADARGQGIGRALVRATLNRLATFRVEGFTLFYLPANPLSSQFWPAMGFTPVVSRFQRRRD